MVKLRHLFLLGPGLSFCLMGCAPGVSTESDSEPIVVQEDYLLTDHLDSLEAVYESPQRIGTPLYEIGFDRRSTVFIHPPAAYRLEDIPNPPGTHFRTAPMMNPLAWAQPTDGVQFEVLCTDSSGAWHPLLDLSIDPANRLEDRIWHDVSLSLDACAEPTTALELRTGCGFAGNCDADWAAWGDPRITTLQEARLKPRQVVLLISIDTLRPDRLGLYGGRQGTGPAIARLAEDGVTFETAISSTPWTLPSHATLLSSSWPLVHGATAKTSIPRGLPLLAEILQEQGWQTAAFVDTPYLGSQYGFGRGFDLYDEDPPPFGTHLRTAALTRTRLWEWLNSADERPAFIFWHLMDVHGPYGASAPHAGTFRSDAAEEDTEDDPILSRLATRGYHDYLLLNRFSSFQDLLDTYDEGVASADAEVGKVLDFLRAAGLYDDATIVVTSDHGESFYDHGVWVGHGLFPTDDEIRVPLVVKLPGNEFAGRRVEHFVGQIDVAPTILDSLDIETPKTFQGKSLITPSPGDRETLHKVLFGTSTNLKASFLRTENFKYIAAGTKDPDYIANETLRFRPGHGLDVHELLSEKLYDLRTDPGETNSLIGPNAPRDLGTFQLLVSQHVRESLALKQELRSSSHMDTPVLSEESRERLRALGYVD